MQQQELVTITGLTHYGSLIQTPLDRDILLISVTQQWFKPWNWFLTLDYDVLRSNKHS